MRTVIVSGLVVLTLVGQVIAAQLDTRDSARLMTMLQIARAVKDAEPDPFQVPERA